MEIEVKILDIDIDSVRETMRKLEAPLVKDEYQNNHIYDFPDNRLLHSKGYARIRVVKDRTSGEKSVYMTTKRMVSQEKYKSMEEHETRIESEEDGIGIFEALGLTLQYTIRKSRESYRYKDTLVEIDIHEKSFCPFPFLEVESPSEEELEEVVGLLGYTLGDTTSQTIFEILRERGLTDRDNFGL